MRHLTAIGALALVVALTALPASVAAQTSNAGTSLGNVRLVRSVMANGAPLAAGTYQVRLSSDPLQPGVGQSPDSERYVEFVRGGKVVAREVATVVSNADIGTLAKGKKPAAGTATVELLKGNDYLRVWINRGGTNYIIHLPVGS